MTFSIAARCEETGMFGLAVSSSSPAVAARCAFARAGVGAAASQNITDPALGERCLDLLAGGLTAKEALDEIVANTPHIEYRQLTAVDAQGTAHCYSGPKTLGTFALASASNVACGGNMLANEQVPQAMVNAFESSKGGLGDRLIQVMQAGVAAGGEAGPVHSAGILLVDKVSWPIANLRVDWHADGDPVGQLQELWELYAPQLSDYVTRAQDPTQAPSYGVPGDL